MFLSTMACFCSCSPGGMKQWIRMRISGRNSLWEAGCMRDSSSYCCYYSLWKVISPSLSCCPARGDGYLTAEEFLTLSWHRSRVLSHHAQTIPGTEHTRDMGKAGNHCASMIPCRWIIHRAITQICHCWWSPGFFFSAPGPTTSKKLGRELLWFSFLLCWVVRAHLQTWVNTLSVLPSKSLQR